MELKTKFPIMFSQCQEYIKHRKYEPTIINFREITYDKSVIPILTDNEIDFFYRFTIEISRHNK